MVMSLKVLLCTFITLNFISTVLCIKCWNCRSSNDPKCADPFDNSTVPITDCKQEKGLKHLPGLRPSMCRKIRQKVNGEWRYIRDCAYLGDVGIQGDERFCLMRTGTYNIFVEYCTCNSKDGCNSATLKNPSVLFTYIILTICIFYTM
ncbi:uncharacterized protein LOC123713537 [Pieris brassicae]|uniref:uncharacterized protein LOC123713537 n=1 Tax=Pieris brassicae TaxID=7116 RepID=UPI001E66163F|nr:uncharacterized protein LOC123713537 [Pieris brassicae]